MRITDLLHEFEATENDGGDGAGFIEPPLLPAPAAEPAAPAPAGVEQQGWQGFSDEDQFRQAVAQEAAAMFEQRLGALLENVPGEVPQGDLNQLLDPMGDQFGTNFLQVLSARDQQLLSQLQPVLDYVQNQQQVAQTQALAEPILAQDSARHGELTDDQRSVAMTLADHYLADQERIHGAGSQRAMSAALTQALQTVRLIAGTASAAGRQESIDQLHAATQGLRVPQGGGEGTPTHVAAPPRSPQELLERTFGPNGMSPLRAA